jgi:hypothetical protein
VPFIGNVGPKEMLDESLCRIKERQPAFDALDEKIEGEIGRLDVETTKALETLESVKSELISIVESEIAKKKEELKEQSDAAKEQLESDRESAIR